MITAIGGCLRSRAVLGMLLLLPTFLGSGCAYYNTFYFAKKYYSQAEQIVQKSQSDRLSPDALKKYEDAIKQCNKVLQFHAGSRWMDDAIYLMGASYYGKKEYEAALRKFDELLANYPDSKLAPRALYMSGLCHYQRRGYDEMEDSFKRVLEVAPRFDQRDEIIYTRALAAEQGTSKSGAIRLYQQLVRQFPHSRRAEGARLRIGDLYFDAGRADSAYICYSRLVKTARTDKGYQDALIKSADAQVRMDQPGEAIKTLEKLVPHDESPQRLGTDEWPVRIRIHLAAAYNAAKQHRQALSTLKLAIERYPASPLAPEAQFEIGYTYEVFLDSLPAARKAYEDMSKFSAQSVFREQGQTRAHNLEQLQSLSTQASGDSASSKEKQAEAALKIAEVYFFAQDRIPDALSKYREILAQFPETRAAPRAAYAVGWIHLNKTEGTRDSAVVDLNRLIRDFPASRQARKAVDLLASAGADTTGLKSLLATTQPDTVAAPADSSALAGGAGAPPDSAALRAVAGSALPDSAFLRSFVGPLPLGGQVAPALAGSRNPPVLRMPGGPPPLGVGAQGGPPPESLPGPMPESGPSSPPASPPMPPVNSPAAGPPDSAGTATSDTSVPAAPGSIAPVAPDTIAPVAPDSVSPVPPDSLAGRPKDGVPR